MGTGMYCLELPAGLCDAGEAPEVTAKREMKEETGYTAEVVSVSPALFVGTPASLLFSSSPRGLLRLC